MQEVSRLTRKVAASNASVLILGETGTGKELVASAIHLLSRRSTGPFIRVNCVALSEIMLESHLFGHLRGAFPGAITNQEGRLRAAEGGSLLLAETHAISLPLQVKLLRAIQEKQFERLGDTTLQQADIRWIAASNRDLLQQVHAGRFREDLYWRLNVVTIELPSLRHRREDIPALVSFFLDHYNDAHDRYVTHIGRDVMQALQEYHWPGNVHELQTYIERAVVTSDTDELTLDILPAWLTRGGVSASDLVDPSVAGKSPADASAQHLLSKIAMARESAGVDTAAYADRMDVKTLTRFVVSRGLAEADEKENVHALVVDQIEKELIAQVLAQCSGVQTKAAMRLGMNRNTLYKKIKQYDLG